MVSKTTYLHNTKCNTSKMAQDKERKEFDNLHQGRYITLFEMLHVILKYPEIIANLTFVKLSTMPLELRASVDIKSDIEETTDGAFITTATDTYRESIDLDHWRMHTANKNLIFDD